MPFPLKVMVRVLFLLHGPSSINTVALEPFWLTRSDPTGNCLYYALSDQVFGDFSHARCIRSRLADHIADHKEYFIQFTPSEGGERRAPRRAAAAAARSAYSSSFSSSCSSASSSPVFTTKDQEQLFESRLAESRKDGVWGGSEQIQAFCQSFERDVHVYTEHGVQQFRDVNVSSDEKREVVHIAYHVSNLPLAIEISLYISSLMSASDLQNFQHYSSVRNIDGPHTGTPSISIGSIASKHAEFVKANANSPTSSTTVVDVATPWKISTIQEHLGGKYDRETIVEMLQQCRGDIDRAFSNLLDEASVASPAADHPETSTSTANTTAEPPVPRLLLKQRLQPSSRSSSPYSTASKRSAEESDAEDNASQPSTRARARAQKRRLLPTNVTVGISFGDESSDLVSLRLRVSPDGAADNAASEATSETGGRQRERRWRRALGGGWPPSPSI